MFAKKSALGLILFLLTAVMAVARPAAAGITSFSIQEEEKMGQDYYKELQKKYKVTEDARITRIGNQIASVCGLENRVKFYLIDMGKDDEPNAFQTPGYIYVTKSLDKMLKDDELTYVMGHEMGHQVKHHIRRAIEKSRKTSFWLIIAGTVAKIPTDILNIGATGIQNKYSRQQEIEADRFGYLVSKQLGINVEVAVEAFKKIMTEKAPPKITQELFGSHPLLNQRTSRLEDAAKMKEYPPLILTYTQGTVVFSPDSLNLLKRDEIIKSLNEAMHQEGKGQDNQEYYLRVEMLKEDYSENLTKNLTKAWNTPAIWYIQGISADGNSNQVNIVQFVPDKGRGSIQKTIQPTNINPLSSQLSKVLAEQVAQNNQKDYKFHSISLY